MVGLDPRPEHFPEPFASHAKTGSRAAAEATREYHRALLPLLADKVAVVKPQAAFFEALGLYGWEVLWDAVQFAKELKLMVVLDAKRGDIGSTSEAYAQAFLGGGQYGDLPKADALTINPYLGEDACKPFLEVAATEKAGLFILVKTSNPGAGLFQDWGEPPLAAQVADQVRQWGSDRIDASGWSAVGAVVGATRPQELAQWRQRMPQSPLLLPGFGFQGGTAAGLEPAFDAKGRGAIVNSSRSILWAHRRPEFAHLPNWESQVEAALEEMCQALASLQQREKPEAHR